MKLYEQNRANLEEQITNINSNRASIIEANLEETEDLLDF